MQPQARDVDRAELKRLVEEAIKRAGGAKALAAAAGIHVANLHAYRRGSQRPHWETVARIAAAGGVMEADLLRAAGWSDRADTSALGPSPLSVLESGFQRLDDRGKTRFLRIAQAILSEMQKDD